MADEKTTEETTDETPEVEAVADEAVADGSDQVAEGDLVADVPAAETEPAPAAEAPAVPPAQSEPKRKKKPADTERGRRQERRGVVVSNAMDKTIVVKVDMIKSHPRYKKVVRRSVKFHAHDEQNAANVGDVVRIVETRPLSATKRWRLAEIVEAAK